MAIDRTGIVNRMKTQTIGVEIEMYNISRETAAKVAADFFGTHRYEYTAYSYSDGYYTWSAWDTQGRRWKFMRDSTIIDTDDNKCEMTTPILHYDDIPMLQELVRRLRKAGAKSDCGHQCGVHIHVGASDHTPQSLTNLVNVMASHENLLKDSLGIDEERIEMWCKFVDTTFLDVLNQRKPRTLGAFADVWYGYNHTRSGWSFCDGDRTHHYNESRYRMLNLHATFTKGTVEFRCFNFQNPNGERRNGLHAGQLKSWIQLVLAINQFAKDSKFCKRPRCAESNQLRTLRNFINNLGLGGEEFATLRQILTANFTRNAARTARRTADDIALMAV